MVKKILNSRVKTITLAAVILGTSTLLSGILGVVRMRLLAAKFDVGSTLDSYFAAFRIPDLISATIITGGIIVSFLPLFSKSYKESKEKGWRLANNIMNISLISLAILSFLVWLFAPATTSLIAPGFSGEEKALTIILTRIMFISPLLFAISGIFSGILQHFDRFIAYAIAPILYNIGIIFGIVFLSRFFSEPISGVAWGVVLGATMHLLVQLPPVINSGYRYRFVFEPKDTEFIQLLRLIFPRMISQASSQINLIVITAIGSFMTAGSVALFNFANNLYAFPIAIIGASFATAAFPSFSRSLADNNIKEFVSNFSLTFRQTLFITAPCSGLLFLLRSQAVALTLGANTFGPEERALTAATLGAFSLSLLFAALVPLITRVFFSFQDTKSPAIVSVISIALNIALSFFFTSALKSGTLLYNIVSGFFGLSGIADIRVVGLALAVSVANLIQLSLLILLLRKKIGDASLRKPFFSVLTAAAIMTLLTSLILRLSFGNIFLQVFLVGFSGVAIYLLVLQVIRPKEIGVLFNLKR